MSLEIISSVLNQMIIQCLFQLTAFFVILKDINYEPIDVLMQQRNPNGSITDLNKLEELSGESYATTAIFLVSCWQ